MIETILHTVKLFAAMVPFLLLVLLNGKTNLKREIRSRQALMPILTLAYCIVLAIFFNTVGGWVNRLVSLVIGLLQSLGSRLGQSGSPLSGVLSGILGKITDKVRALNPIYLLFIAANFVFVLAHIILKRIILTFLKRLMRSDSKLHKALAGWFYEYDVESDRWYVKKHCGQARTYLKTFYVAGIVVAMLAMLVSGELFRRGLLAALFYPVFGILILGECCFFLHGLTKSEAESEITGEADDASRKGDYTLLRKSLRRLFGDKLEAENSSFTSFFDNARSNDEILFGLENSEVNADESYGIFMRKKQRAGLKLDQNYMLSGLDMMHGKSILFNNPFYYDLIPYAFYPMNRVLLRHGKVLIVLGRHGVEEDILTWCEEGFTSVNSVPGMWRAGVLTDEPQELDVGVMSRSDVHRLKLHAANAEFFSQVEFIVLIEPSRLITTAQIGLNSIVRWCTADGRAPTFCSTDKNCDGLVDALSHILMTSLTEVSATNRPGGTSSYMCWMTDNELWQHRMLPNISRYLGVGTELSFVALKNQVSAADWYGGDSFPVLDEHWIAGQYYYDLLHYADLPTSQDKLSEVFRVTPNLWDAKTEPYHYMTVEDESCNMFEVRREFSTRATVQGFVNVISPEYLLREYMARNNSIFITDPKAIPTIVADYARTARNVVLRLFLRMSVGLVPEGEIRRELSLMDLDTTELKKSLWHELCLCCSPDGEIPTEREKELMERTVDGKELVFSEDLIRTRKKFSLQSGRMETCWYIDDEDFAGTVLYDLQNADYIAETEREGRQYLGTELHGQVFQKYLPGQFFTYGGKYYEMLRMTKSGQLLVRRAADHITGRPAYRQVRRYIIRNAVDSPLMGDRVDVSGMKVTKQYADIRVETPAYWKLDSYNDFAHGRLTTVSGIPDREYYRKQLLRIELPDAGGRLTENVRHTLTVLFNELFRTLFAENHGLLAAVCSGDPALPETYSLETEGSAENCIYIIEDSMMDVGLLEAVSRYLDKIFAIACDYLEWHRETLAESLNPPPEPEIPDFTSQTPEAEEQGKQPKTKLGRFFKKLFGGIGGFFKKLFGKRKAKDGEAGGSEAPAKEKKRRKKKKDRSAPEAPPVPAPETEPVTESEPIPEAEPAADIESIPKDGRPIAEATEDAEAIAEPVAPDEPLTEADTEEPDSETGSVDEPGVSDTPDVDAPIADRSSDDEAPDAEAEELPEDDGGAPPVLFSLAPPRILFDTLPDGTGDGADEAEPSPRPYHERHYLLYGGETVPEGLVPEETEDYLKALGYGGNELTQARNGRTAAELVEREFTPGKPGSRYCDFCGRELVGTEYEVLRDGRERCMTCSRSAVKTAAEFKQIYREVLYNMETFYGIQIRVPVRVEMVNAKKLHKRLKKTFVPTSNADGRVLGVAIKDKSGYSLLLENGAPRMQSIMTTAHELTHIWQYLNWDPAAIRRLYGASRELEIYEGMAKWSEIQYAWLMNEPAAAKREELITRARNDEYGNGFRMYAERYPLSEDIRMRFGSPFDDKQRPL